jgi:hypothetical protein
MDHRLSDMRKQLTALKVERYLEKQAHQASIGELVIRLKASKESVKRARRYLRLPEYASFLADQSPIPAPYAARQQASYLQILHGIHSETNLLDLTKSQCAREAHVMKAMLQMEEESGTKKHIELLNDIFNENEAIEDMTVRMETIIAQQLCEINQLQDPELATFDGAFCKSRRSLSFGDESMVGTELSSCFSDSFSLSSQCSQSSTSSQSSLLSQSMETMTAKLSNWWSSSKSETCDDDEKMPACVQTTLTLNTDTEHGPRWICASVGQLAGDARHGSPLAIGA